MIRASKLFESELIAVARLDHPHDLPHEDPDLEVSPDYSINLIERGRFSVTYEGRTWCVDAAQVFVTAPGQVQRFVHDECGHAPGDVCVAVTFKNPLRDDIRGQLGTLRGNVPVVPMDNRLGYLRQRLLNHVSASADALAVDLIAAEVLAASLESTQRRLYRPGQLAWYAQRVDAIREQMDRRFEDAHTLSRLAREAGMSPFHLARLFRELTGLPPHRYLLRRRLNAAAERLRDGCSVTDTCFAVGFRSLSHFIHAFRRAYGVSPSRFSASPDTRSS